MLRHLNIDEMVSLTSAWVTNPQAKALFLSIAEIAPLHPKVVEVNAGLLQLSVADVAEDEQDALGAKVAAVDRLHDALTRAVSSGLEADLHHALAVRPVQVKRAEQLERARAVLLPGGLSVNNTSYLAEAGNATRVEALLRDDAELVSLLGSIPVRGGGTLLGLTRRWVRAGKRIGQLEHERDVLVAKAEDPADVRVARARWMKVVSAVLSTLELSDAPTMTVETIRGPVRRASARAGLRYVRRDEPEGEGDGEGEGAAAVDDAAAGESAAGEGADRAS